MRSKSSESEPQPHPQDSSSSKDGPLSASQVLEHTLYDELRKLAAARMANERADHTLSATALVHEAYVRLVDDRDATRIVEIQDALERLETTDAQVADLIKLRFFSGLSIP